MKITVDILHTQEIINLEVEPNTTIKSIKAKFLEEALIPNDRGLKFDGYQLENHRTVSSYDIEEGSQLYYYGHVSDRLLGGTHIFIKKKPFEKRFAGQKPVFRVLAKASDKIEDVLARFLQQIGGPFQIEEHQLIFDGEVLENSLTLADYNITNGSLVNWVRFGGCLLFFVKNLLGKTITYSGEYSDTIANVKAMIHTVEGIPAHQMALIYGGSYLFEDSETLFDCDIKNESTFQLVLLMGSSHPRKDGNPVDYVGKVKKGYGAYEAAKKNKKEVESKKDDVKNKEEGEENKREDLVSNKEDLLSEKNDVENKMDDVKNKEEGEENKREDLVSNKEKLSEKSDVENKREDGSKEDDVKNKEEGEENKKEDEEIKEEGVKDKDKKNEPPTRKRKADSQEDESYTTDQQCIIS